MITLLQLKIYIVFTQSANQHMHTFNFYLFIKPCLKFLKTLLHVSVSDFSKELKTP